jgi:alpha/beta superfamily hydrolase
MIGRAHASSSALLALVAALAGCSSDDSHGGAGGAGAASGAGGAGGALGGSAGTAGDAGTAGSSGAAGSGAATCTFGNLQTLVDESDLVVERFTYASGTLSVFAELCRPNKPGPLPVLIWNHGGVGGIGDGDREFCANVAKNAGWATLMSEYRGEGGSDGSIEVCLGEVDDVLALTSCAAAQPRFDPARFVMAGASHGGCITLRALQRSAPVAAAVDIFGPTDFAEQHAFWKAELAADPSSPWAPAYQELLAVTELAAGGTPDQAPAEYAKRSPVHFASELAAHQASLLIVHGVEDALVPAAQSCAMAHAAGGFEARHYDDAATTPLTSPPAGCEGWPIPWLATPKPYPGWAGQRHLIVYDGAGHDLSLSVPGQAAMITDFVTFLGAKMPP